MGILSLIYGHSGVGKTLACCAAFPRATFIASPRSVRGTSTVLGFDLPPGQIRSAVTLRDMLKEVEAALSRGEDVVVDDLSPMAEYSVDEYRRKLSGYDIFNAVTADLLHVRKMVDQARSHVVMNAHLGQPHVNSLNGRLIRGGPRLPGQTPELIVTAFDQILRFDVDPTRTVGLPRSAMCMSNAADYVYKDRFDVVRGAAPMNLREILIAAGIDLRRPPGLEWMDQVVTNVAASLSDMIVSGQITVHALANKGQIGPVFASYRQAIGAKYTQIVELQTWIMQDAFDRIVLAINRRSQRTGADSYLGG